MPERYDGKIIISTAKDDLLNNYGLVKGGKEILDQNIRKEFIGIKENEFGFEGLVKDKHQARNSFDNQVIIEKQ